MKGVEHGLQGLFTSVECNNNFHNRQIMDHRFNAHDRWDTMDYNGLQ